MGNYNSKKVADQKSYRITLACVELLDKMLIVYVEMIERLTFGC